VRVKGRLKRFHPIEALVKTREFDAAIGPSGAGFGPVLKDVARRPLQAAESIGPKAVVFA
jgi:ABC-type iron transport system FetAB ATPase subunit